MSIKGAIFDLDGTLLDSMDVWSQVDIEFLGKRGIAVPDDYADAIAPMMFREVAEYTIDRFSLPDSPESVMEEWNSMAKHKYAEEVKLKPGALEVIKLLQKNGVKMGIATTNISEVFMPCLVHNGVEKYFDVVTETDDVGVAKDKPDIYLITAERLGVKPTECIVFEDIVMALNSARAGGFTTFGIWDDHGWAKVDRAAFDEASDYPLDSWSAARDVLANII
ncbi:MAG: HAD family phosphatase [Eubacterium sp.]|nr:HAD family phosphatase [Eubacterium sp.]